MDCRSQNVGWLQDRNDPVIHARGAPNFPGSHPPSSNRERLTRTLGTVVKAATALAGVRVVRVDENSECRTTAADANDDEFHGQRRECNAVAWRTQAVNPKANIDGIGNRED